MAMFREHIAAGAVVSIAAVALTYFYAWITDPVLLATLFVVMVVGSFLPDVDSDSGLPFYLVFGTAAMAATGYVVLYVLKHPPANPYYQIGIPLGALAFFWIVIGGIVKRITKHRGMWHSTPAMLIAGLGTLVLARHFGLGEYDAIIFGVGMSLGYLTHLILDELHGGYTLTGIPFLPEDSMGTTLKFFSRSTWVNLTTYAILAVLVHQAYGIVSAEALSTISEMLH